MDAMNFLKKWVAVGLRKKRAIARLYPLQEKRPVTPKLRRRVADLYPPREEGEAKPKTKLPFWYTRRNSQAFEHVGFLKVESKRLSKKIKQLKGKFVNASILAALGIAALLYGSVFAVFGLSILSKLLFAFGCVCIVSGTAGALIERLDIKIHQRKLRAVETKMLMDERAKYLASKASLNAESAPEGSQCGSERHSGQRVTAKPPMHQDKGRVEQMKRMAMPLRPARGIHYNRLSRHSVRPEL